MRLSYPVEHRRTALGLPRWESFRFHLCVHFDSLEFMNRLILSYIFLAVAITVGASACKSNNPGTPPPPPAPIPPAGYAGDVPLPPEQGGNTGGRFGFTGASPATSSGAAPSAPGPAPAPTAPTPPPSSAPTAAEMPFANPVPGNPLAVTLPGANASLGQISVEKFDSSNNPTGEPLKRGTQVQIPDPNNPGKKIYFKVP